MARNGTTERPDEVALELARIAIEAGAILLAQSPETCGRHIKPDGSPTTDGDLAAEKLILARLGALWPAIPVIAEESCADQAPGPLYFLVDPLDGTRDYLHGSPEYTVNIALLAGERPIAAAVAAPALDRLFVAGMQARAGRAAADALGDLAPIRVRPAPADGLVALTSRRHGDAASEAGLARLPVAARREVSSSLKFCLIAAGEADLYLRFGPTMEWDVAAGDHVLAAAGGRVVQPGGRTMTYGHHDRGYRNPPFAACGDPATAAALALPEEPSASPRA